MRLLIAIFLLAPLFVFGQQSAADSLRLKLQKDSAHIYRFKKVHFLFSLDQRATFISTPKDNYASFGLFGAKAGLVYNERHKVGLGVYTIRNRNTKLQHSGLPDESIKLTFNYLSLFYEYLFISNRWWDIGVPVEAGLGRYKITPPPPGNADVDHPWVIPTGLALDVHFKPIRWLSINGMGGYRHVINTNNSIDLSNWFYAAGISISLRHISEDTRYYLKKRKYHKDISRLPAQQIP